MLPRTGSRYGGDSRAYQQIIDRVRAEYQEMPGLRLTLDQAQRLFGLDHSVCIAILGSLVLAQFLSLEPDGRYARCTTEAISRRPVSKAHLRARALYRRPADRR